MPGFSPPEVEGRFAYHAPTPDQLERIQRVRRACMDLAHILMTDVKDSRERSLAITNLEQVSMWANRAIVFESK